MKPTQEQRISALKAKYQTATEAQIAAIIKYDADHVPYEMNIFNRLVTIVNDELQSIHGKPAVIYTDGDVSFRDNGIFYSLEQWKLVYPLIQQLAEAERKLAELTPKDCAYYADKGWQEGTDYPEPQDGFVLIVHAENKDVYCYHPFNGHWCNQRAIAIENDGIDYTHFCIKPRSFFNQPTVCAR